MRGSDDRTRGGDPLILLRTVTLPSITTFYNINSSDYQKVQAIPHHRIPHGNIGNVHPVPSSNGDKGEKQHPKVLMLMIRSAQQEQVFPCRFSCTVWILQSTG